MPEHEFRRLNNGTWQRRTRYKSENTWRPWKTLTIKEFHRGRNATTRITWQT